MLQTGSDGLEEQLPAYASAPRYERHLIHSKKELIEGHE